MITLGSSVGWSIGHLENALAADDSPSVHTSTIDSYYAQSPRTYDSDERLKQEIFYLGKEENLAKLLALKAIRFKYKDKPNLPKGVHLGFIAQEVKEIIPELVKKEGEFFKLNYQGIIPVLVEAIKELNDKITRLEKD